MANLKAPLPMVRVWTGVYSPQSDIVTESQSHKVTESQTLKGTQYTGGQNFLVPDFNKLPYSLRSQGDDLK